MKIRLAKKIMKARLLMKKKYSFANAKPVPFGKIDYVLKAITDYKPIFGHRTTIKNQTIWMAFMKFV